MLSRLDITDYARVAALFPPSTPNVAFARGVLEGKLPGEVFAEIDGDRARSCLIVGGSPFCFIGGEMRGDALEEALSLLETKEAVTLVHPAPSAAEAIASRHGLTATKRSHFRDPHPEKAAERRSLIPEPYRGARIDAELFAQSNWRDAVLGIFGSAENYLAHHHGYALLHEGRLVAEAHAVVGGDFVELGAFVHPEHRRLGLTTIVLDPLIRLVSERGYRSFASCFATHPASAKAIVNAGLQHELDYLALTRAH